MLYGYLLQCSCFVSPSILGDTKSNGKGRCQNNLNASIRIIRSYTDLWCYNLLPRINFSLLRRLEFSLKVCSQTFTIIFYLIDKSCISYQREYRILVPLNTTSHTDTSERSSMIQIGQCCSLSKMAAVRNSTKAFFVDNFSWLDRLVKCHKSLNSAEYRNTLLKSNIAYITSAKSRLFEKNHRFFRRIKNRQRIWEVVCEDVQVN